MNAPTLEQALTDAVKALRPCLAIVEMTFPSMQSPSMRQVRDDARAALERLDLLLKAKA